MSPSGQPVCSEMGAVLLSYTRQIALGMGYLTLKQYVHRDLAARNVLVSDEGICKVMLRLLPVYVFNYSHAHVHNLL